MIQNKLWNKIIRVKIFLEEYIAEKSKTRIVINLGTKKAVKMGRFK